MNRFEKGFQRVYKLLTAIQEVAGAPPYEGLQIFSEAAKRNIELPPPQYQLVLERPGIVVELTAISRLVMDLHQGVCQ